MAPAATSAVAGLLDGVSAAIAGAYGLRKLRSAYAGAAVRVRRSLDSAETDIGFAGTGLDTGALLTFCGSGSGFVTKWYDQSVAQQDAIQTAGGAQPQIVSGAVLILFGNAAARPVMRFVGASSQYLGNTAFAMGGAASACASVACRTATTPAYERLIGFAAPGEQDYTNSASIIWGYFTGGNLSSYQGGPAAQTALGTAPFQAASVFSGAASVITLDGVASAPAAASGSLAAVGTMNIGLGGGTSYWDGTMAEHIVISGPLSAADQATIRASQRAYYGTP